MLLPWQEQTKPVLRSIGKASEKHIKLVQQKQKFVLALLTLFQVHAMSRSLSFWLWTYCLKALKQPALKVYLPAFHSNRYPHCHWGNESQSLIYCSLLHVVYNFTEIKSNFPAPFWDYVTSTWYLCGVVSVSLMRSCVRIFLLIEILVKTMNGICWGNFKDSA